MTEFMLLETISYVTKLFEEIVSSQYSYIRGDGNMQDVCSLVVVDGISQKM